MALLEMLDTKPRVRPVSCCIDFICLSRAPSCKTYLGHPPLLLSPPLACVNAALQHILLHCSPVRRGGGDVDQRSPRHGQRSRRHGGSLNFWEVHLFAVLVGGAQGSRAEWRRVQIESRLIGHVSTYGSPSLPAAILVCALPRGMCLPCHQMLPLIHPTTFPCHVLLPFMLPNDRSAVTFATVG